MAFFGRKFDQEKLGEARPAFFSARLFGRNVSGACDWSRAHSEKQFPSGEKMKFQLPAHPIEREGANPRMEPGADYRAKQIDEMRKVLGAANSEVFREVLKKHEAQELIDKIGDKVDEDFIHDFRNWIAGIGKRSDYVKAGVPLTSVGQAKPLSDHPSVISFIDRLTSRVIDYYAEIANMKMRGPGVGRRGGPATLNDLWLYFKYVVRNDPVDPRDFVEEVKRDISAIGNRNGIVDERSAAPSLKDVHPDPVEQKKRAAPEDRQSKKKARPEALAAHVAGDPGKTVLPVTEAAPAAAAPVTAPTAPIPAAPAPTPDPKIDEERKSREEEHARQIEKLRLEREHIERQAHAALASAEEEKRAREAYLASESLFKDQKHAEEMRQREEQYRAVHALMLKEQEERKKDVALFEAERIARTQREAELAAVLNATKEEANRQLVAIQSHFQNEIAQHAAHQKAAEERAAHAYQVALLTEGAANEHVIKLVEHLNGIKAQYEAQLIASQQAAHALIVASAEERNTAVMAYQDAMQKLETTNRELVATSANIDKESRESLIAYERGMDTTHVAYGKVSEEEAVDLELKNRAAAADAAPAPAPTAPAPPPETTSRKRKEPTAEEKTAAASAEAGRVRETDLKKMSAAQWVDEVAHSDKRSRGGNDRLAAQLLSSTGLDDVLRSIAADGNPDVSSSRQIKVMKLLWQEEGAFASVPLSAALASKLGEWLKRHPSISKTVRQNEGPRSTGLS
jgi:hypothetical protein